MENTDRAVTVLIAEPLAIVRAALRALLAGESALRVVGDVGSAAELPHYLARLRPDVLLLVPSLPGLPPGNSVAEVAAAQPTTKVVVLADPPDRAAAIALLDAGAAGCFLKNDRPEEFLHGIRAAAAGDLAISNAVARILLGRVSDLQQAASANALTEREGEILDQLVAGHSNKEIAQNLYLSVRTVEVHLRSVYAKLGVRSRLEAVTRTLNVERPSRTARPC